MSHKTAESFRIADNLNLVRQIISTTKEAAKPVEVPTNHIAVIDCSGSMSYDLPRIRDQVKKKLPKLLAEKDTLSIIWFSGRGEFSALLEAEPVSTLADLKDVEKAIDRWLKPVGLTGFKEPLEEVSRLCERVGKKLPGSVFSLFFMSDGCDNQWNRADVLKAVEKAGGGLASATFVEYGYYADRPLLTAMAEKAGGTLIHAEAFDKYQPIFEAAMAKRPTGAPRIEVEILGDPIGGFVWIQRDGDLTTFAVEGGKSRIPEDTSEIWYLSPSAVGTTGPNLDDIVRSVVKPGAGKQEATLDTIVAASFAALSLFSVRMKSEVIFPILKSLGDVRFIHAFSSCFGKQKYSEFMDEAKAAVFEGKKRFVTGYDPTKVPADDAYTILDLLRLLASDENNKVLLDHPEFKFSRISRKRIDSAEVMSPEEQKKVSEITAKMASEKSAKKLKELQEELAKLTAGKEALKFEQKKQSEGYSISSLTFNEDRPNISLNLRLEGTVDISPKIPDALKDKIPSPFPTFVFRNRNVVADGLVNMDTLPVRVTKEIADQLAKLLPDEAKPAKLSVSNDYVEGVINLRALPVINRKMCKAASAKALFEKQFELEKARAAQKVFKAFKDERVAKKESASFKETYGEDGAEWLKEQGFTDYSGFSPKMIQAESTDFYVGKALEVSIKGYSKLPSMNEYKKQASTGKFNGPGLLMKPFVEECEKFLTAKSSEDPIKWAEKKAKEAISEARRLIFEIAQTKFAIVVGQVWFSEFSSLDENTMTLNQDGAKLDCKVEMKEVQIKI